MLRYLVFIIFSGASLFAQSPHYAIHDLGALNNGSVTGINIRGQVIGYETQSDGHVRAFRTAPNTAINWTTDDLGSLGGTTTRPHGINALGQVVGESTLSSGDTRAFRTAANQPIQPSTDNLGTLGGSMSKAFAINDSAQVTGTSTATSDSKINYAFETAPNRPINPATDRIDAHRGISYGDANGLYINNRGHVLGTVADYPTAFLHTERTTLILPFIQYIWQDFAGLTEQDQAVYTSQTGLALWQNGKSMELTICASPCVPTGINSSLQVIGSTIKNSFLYSNGVLYDLSTLLPSGWTLPDTSGGPAPLRINDLGQIAGIATLNGETHVFRLDPVLSVNNAIEKALNLLSTMRPNAGRRSPLMTTTKAALESRLSDALDSWSHGNSAATRGLLNEFETLVRAQIGQTLTNDQADQLIDMAEAAFALT